MYKTETEQFPGFNPELIGDDHSGKHSAFLQHFFNFHGINNKLIKQIQP